MRVYQRIDHVADWERLRGSAGETWEVDFKARLSAPDAAELAKDVAAFANYLGGVILVGIQERPVPTPCRCTEAELKVTQKAFEDAVKDRCRPAPIVTYAILDVGAEGHVLAVNVDPLPDAIVGAAVGDRNAGVWRFPIRANQHTIFLSPEQLPMYMNAATRSVLIRLSQIPSKATVEVTFRRPTNKTNTTPSWVGVLLTEPPNVEGNYLAVFPKQNASEGKFHPLTHIPLDDIESVWRAADGIWKLRVRGHFAMSEHGEYHSNPSNAEFIAS